MERYISVDPERCTGCGQCELACSFQHEGVFAPSLARIRVVRYEHLCLSVPVTCAYCERPVCEEVCPTRAIVRDPATGAAKVIAGLCIGCKECVTVCPLGAMDLHPDKGTAMRCDLCDGRPACVGACAAGALKLQAVSDFARDRRRARVASLGIS